MAAVVRSLLLALTLALPAGHSAGADIARFEYEAVVTAIDVPSGHPVEGRLALGDVIRGTLQYDLNLGDYVGNLPNVGIYEALPAGVNRFHAAGGDGFLFDSTLVDRPAFAATVDDGQAFDTLLVRVSGDTSPSTLARADTTFVEMGLLLETPNTGLFASDDLPDRLSLADFDLAGMDFFGTGTAFPTFLVQTSITSLETMPPMLPGDYSGNGLVDQADLDLTLVHWGEAAGVSATWIGPPPEGVVDQSELDHVLASWGAAPAKAGIPEPATLLLAIAAGGAALYGRCARRSVRRSGRQSG